MDKKTSRRMRAVRAIREVGTEDHLTDQAASDLLGVPVHVLALERSDRRPVDDWGVEVLGTELRS